MLGVLDALDRLRRLCHLRALLFKELGQILTHGDENDGVHRYPRLDFGVGDLDR